MLCGYAAIRWDIQIEDDGGGLYQHVKIPEGKQDMLLMIILVSVGAQEYIDLRLPNHANPYCMILYAFQPPKTPIPHVIKSLFNHHVRKLMIYYQLTLSPAC